TVCQNEGRPNPNKCSECQCPSGFGGVDCSERQAPSEGLSCGESLKASYQWQTLNVDSVVGTGSAIVANRTNPHQCTWHIQAPKGKKIQYKVDYIGHSGNEDALCY
uniref:CUB domain-containing protein n=1 Tax=Steinernema glaseri TaxID=37863 RepID=A0A1I7YI59_9BILA